MKLKWYNYVGVTLYAVPIVTGLISACLIAWPAWPVLLAFLYVAAAVILTAWQHGESR